MQWLNRIPIWMWAMITLALVYGTWNPTEWSLYHYVVWSDARPSGRFLTAVLVLAIFAFYLHETFLTFNKVGALIFVLIVAATVWLAVDWGLIGFGSAYVWAWLTPAILALALLVGLQGNRIYRNATGRVPVSVDHHDHDAHVPTDVPEHRG